MRSFVVFNFFLFRVASADPVATLFRGRNLTDSQREALTRQFGLDGSQFEQFLRYVEQTVQFNLGRSYATNRPVWQEIWDAAPQTIALVGVSDHPRDADRAHRGRGFGLAARVVEGHGADVVVDGDLVDAGLLARNAPAHLARRSGSGSSRPGGIEDPGVGGGIEGFLDKAHHMFLPALTLTLAYFGEYALIMRSSVLDTMREDYLVLARAKGLRDVQVRNRHAVRNALLPSTALIAISFGFVLSGAIAVETVFSWPGLGLLTYEALRGPDLPLLQGLFLVFSAAVILFNLLAELVYPFLDPRVRR